jgi:predicted RNase H-like HicB family nuclease
MDTGPQRSDCSPVEFEPTAGVNSPRFFVRLFVSKEQRVDTSLDSRIAGRPRPDVRAAPVERNHHGSQCLHPDPRLWNCRVIDSILDGGVAMHNEFTAVFERDGDWFIAYSPEIPGANGQGRTKEEARASLAAAIALILADRREDGLRAVPPEDERETVTVE